MDYSAQKDYPTSAISVYHILSLVALSLFFLNEGKFAVGKGSPAAYMPVSYTHLNSSSIERDLPTTTLVSILTPRLRSVSTSRETMAFGSRNSGMP